MLIKKKVKVSLKLTTYPKNIIPLASDWQGLYDREFYALCKSTLNWLSKFIMTEFDKLHEYLYQILQCLIH